LFTEQKAEKLQPLTQCVHAPPPSPAAQTCSGKQETRHILVAQLQKSFLSRDFYQKKKNKKRDRRMEGLEESSMTAMMGVKGSWQPSV